VQIAVVVWLEGTCCRRDHDEAVARGRDDDRLRQFFGTDRVGEPLQVPVVEPLTRLAG
jgi:hypothetical protein